MDINLNVKISADERLMQVLGAIADAWGTHQEAPQPPAPLPPKGGEAPLPPKGGETVRKAVVPMVAPMVAPQPTAPANVMAEPMPMDEAPAEPIPAAEVPAASYDDAALLDAIDRCRTRIEGEGWKENPETKKSKLHKALSEIIRQEAAKLAAEEGIEVPETKPGKLPEMKPTMLPDGVLRVRFVRTLDEIVLGDDGEITFKLPY